VLVLWGATMTARIIQLTQWVSVADVMAALRCSQKGEA
jgi:hypothetical protein